MVDTSQKEPSSPAGQQEEGKRAASMCVVGEGTRAALLIFPTIVGCEVGRQSLSGSIGAARLAPAGARAAPSLVPKLRLGTHAGKLCFPRRERIGRGLDGK